MEAHPFSIKSSNIPWKILVIDDDKEDYIIAREMLTEARGRKYIVEWASSFQAGREKLFSTTENTVTASDYQAVLIDYELGPHNGLELIREAVARNYPTPLILFTSRGSYEIDLEAMRAGATLYLTKNEVNPLLLERAIRYAVEIKDKERALRQSEAALRASEAFLRESEERERAKLVEINAILDAVPAIVWVTHDPDARKVYGNWAAHEFLRVPQGKNLSKSAGEGQSPVNFRVFQNGSELSPEELPLQITAATGKPLRNFEEDVVFDDGSQAHLLGNVTPLLDENGQPRGAVSAFIDITERNLIERELQERETQLQQALAKAEESQRTLAAIMENVPEGITVAYGPEAKISMVSRYGQDLLGGPHAEKTTAQIAADWKVYHEDGIRLLPADELPLIRAIHRGEVVKNVELVQVNAAGKRLPLSCNAGPIRDASGTIVGGVVSWRDITEQKISIETLRENERKYRELARDLEVERGKLTAAFDNLPVGVGLGDAQGNTLALNSVGLKLHGFETIQDMFSRMDQYIHDFELLYLDGRRMPIEEWPVSRAIRGEFVHDYELCLRNQIHGTERILSYSVAPVRGSNGEVVQIVYVIQDLTERKQAEAVLADYAEKLQQSNRELEQFAFVASHDLQEPLRKIRLFANAIQQKLHEKLDDDTEDSFQRMINASDRMQAMIQDLLELSRVSTQGRPFTQIDLSRVAADVASDLEARIHRTRGQVIIEPLPVIEADPIQIHQALLNIIANALKFHKPGTPPVVKISGQVFQAPDAPCESVRIFIEDNGIGFDEAQFEQMLQPFKRLQGRSQYEGNGMGLAIVKKIIDRHQGQINAHSQPGRGATFIITLPVKRQD